MDGATGTVQGAAGAEGARKICRVAVVVPNQD